MDFSRAVHPIRRSDPPEDSDRNRPENRPIRLSQQSAAGHLFQKPTPAGRSRFSSPKSEKTRSDRCAKNIQQKFPESGRNFQNPAIFSRFRRYFPDSGSKFPDSDFKFPDSSNKFSYFSDLSSRPSKISPDPVRSPPDLAFFRLKSTILTGFFTVDGSNWTDHVSDAKSTVPI